MKHQNKLKIYYNLKKILKQVLSQQTNPGIKYEYLLPTNLGTSEEGSSDTDYSNEDVSLSYKLKAANFQSNTSSATAARKKRKFSWTVVGFSVSSCIIMQYGFLLTIYDDYGNYIDMNRITIIRCLLM